MDFEVACASGSCRGSSPAEGTVHFPHPWTREGVEVTAAFTGAHLLHASVAGCVLNDVHREAERLGVRVDGVRVRASGGFGDGWVSTGVDYAVEVDSPADAATLERLLAVVDEVAEIPRALRAGAPVRRIT